MPVIEETDENAVAALDPAEEHLRQLLKSQSFLRADTQRRLLEYLWEHRAETLSEYALATEALGRKTDFDSAVDASVRVHISRLRRKLKDYYQETGEPERFTIPTGTHQLVVETPRPLAPEALPVVAPATPVTAEPMPRYTRVHPVFFGVAALLLVVASFSGWLLGRHTAAAPRVQASAFWSGFLARNKAPIRIVLPTPTFFQFANDKDLRIRSTRVNDFQDANLDPAFRALTAKLGQPTLEQHYTVTSDTLAAVGMARYLDTLGGTQRVSFDVMRDADMVALEQFNVIALGTYQTLHPFHQYLESMNFSLNHDEAAANNGAPQAGEKAVYPVVQEAPEHLIDPRL